LRSQEALTPRVRSVVEVLQHVSPFVQILRTSDEHLAVLLDLHLREVPHDRFGGGAFHAEFVHEAAAVEEGRQTHAHADASRDPLLAVEVEARGQTE
jgi:hypothetical protein